MLEQFYCNKRQILKRSQEFFQNSTSLIPKIGCELEFFLLPKRDDVIAELDAELQKNFSLIYKTEKEQGINQVEIKTTFTSDLTRLCEELESAKNFIKNFADKKNLIASFTAQPFADDCGSALQFNISLHDHNDKNLFEFDKFLLTKSAAALLEMTNSMMIFLAPKEEDYLRFSREINCDLFKKGKFTAPINLSFGGDNRTCAIRIPKLTKRLEYRPAAADADSWLCISAILSAIFYGINHDLVLSQQIYGNAFDEKYQLKNFCKNLAEAEENFFCEGNFVKKYLLLP